MSINGKFLGREFDEALLADLPDNVEGCGENGEFHTFVYDGSGFAQPDTSGIRLDDILLPEARRARRRAGKEACALMPFGEARIKEHRPKRIASG